MSQGLTPALVAGQCFAFVGGSAFLVIGIVLSYRRRRLHPFLLLCISAISFSWIEAPYDWAMYAQFAPALPRMPSWWPADYTWGRLPVSVPLGYIEYFMLPAIVGVAIARRLIARFRWRRPQTLLTVGLVVGYVWALLFNGVFGVRAGVFYYGRVIPHLAMFGGTKHQYPLYDALAMGVQMMVFTYLLGRIDAQGRTVVEAWAARRTSTKRRATALSIAAIVVLGNLLYGSVFAPHLVTKLRGDVTEGPSGELFAGVPDQPLHGGTSSGRLR
ncbi:MAG TPA: spirocyclase AveC family protein [Mycobacteriales bacterium]|nr:spirocyclase AveC family protein [Mycobacteriales bacterium]